MTKNSEKADRPYLYGLSVKQPWASQIASGKKTIEYRSYRFNWRGPIIICSSKNPVIPGLLSGVTICQVDLVDCIKKTYEDEYQWILENPRPVKPMPIKGIVMPWPWKGPEVEFI